MLKDSRRCRTPKARNNFHGIYRARTRDLIKAEDFEALSMQESMRGHIKVIRRGYEAKYYERRQGTNWLKSFLENHVGQDIDVVTNKIRFAFKESNCSRFETLDSLKWETVAHLPWSFPDFAVEDGKLVALQKESRRTRRRKALKYAVRVVKTEARNKAFVKVAGLWYLAEFRDSRSFVKDETYYNAVAETYRTRQVHMRDLVGNYTYRESSKVWDYSCNGRWTNSFVYSLQPVNSEALKKIRKVIEDSAGLGWVEDERGFERCHNQSPNPLCLSVY